MTTPNQLGQQVMAVSMSVTMASDQTAFPVSMSGTVDVSDRAARLLGHVTIDGQPVSVDTELPAAAALTDANGNPTTPMVGAALLVWDSAAAAWVRVKNGASTGDAASLTGGADVAPFMWNGASFDRLRGDTTAGLKVNHHRVPLVVIQQPAANTGATLTLAAGGAGLFHYITHIRIERSATAALAGTASLAITTTNLNGLAWKVGNLMAAGGTQIDVDQDFTVPIRSAAANTATTIVLPAPGLAVLFSAWVYYHVAP